MAQVCKDDLPDGQSGKFLQGGLDRWNRVDPVRQIRRLAHARSSIRAACYYRGKLWEDDDGRHKHSLVA